MSCTSPKWSTVSWSCYMQGWRIHFQNIWFVYLTHIADEDLVWEYLVTLIVILSFYQSDTTAKLRCKTETLFSHALCSKALPLKKPDLLLGEHMKQKVSKEDLHYQRAVRTAVITIPAPALITSFPVEQKADHIQDAQACQNSRFQSVHWEVMVSCELIVSCWLTAIDITCTLLAISVILFPMTIKTIVNELSIPTQTLLLVFCLDHFFHKWPIPIFHFAPENSIFCQFLELQGESHEVRSRQCTIRMCQ